MMKTDHKYKHERGMVLSEFLAQMFTLDVDELVISEFIGIRNERKVFEFWEKLRGSLYELSTANFRKLAIRFVNDNNLFDEFLMANPHLVSSKLAADPNSKCFPTLLGNTFLSAYLPKNIQLKYEPLNGTLCLMLLYFYNVFDSKVIDEMRKDHNILLNNKNWRGKYIYEDEIKRSAAALTIIYNITKSEILAHYFKDKKTVESWVECVSRKLVDQIELVSRNY